MHGDNLHVIPPCTEPFWVVWAPFRRPPMFRHKSLQAATVEAERLARANPGETFIVLESVCSRTFSDMACVDLRPQEITF